MIMMDKAEVTDYIWNDQDYHDDFFFPKSSLRDAEMNDVSVTEGTTVKKYFGALSPPISKTYSYDSPDIKGLGGPVYI